MSRKSDKVEVVETDAQIEAKLTERFQVLEYLTEAALTGDANAAIISGPPGLGKSFTVEKAMKEFDPNGINSCQIKGYVRATGLYKLLWKFKEKGQVIVFDDADTVFFDDTSLNLLKAVCDTCETRTVSWLSEANLVDEDSGDVIPSHFEFNGTVLFLTNIDFDAYIAKGHKLAPHLSAMISRAHYIDLAMKTRRDYLVRIRQVIKLGLLSNMGLSKAEQKDVVDFIETNHNILRELSLRIAIKIGNLRKMPRGDWKAMAKITCCKAQ
jgi:hypothetical protein